MLFESEKLWRRDIAKFYFGMRDEAVAGRPRNYIYSKTSLLWVRVGMESIRFDPDTFGMYLDTLMYLLPFRFHEKKEGIRTCLIQGTLLFVEQSSKILTIFHGESFFLFVCESFGGKVLEFGREEFWRGFFLMDFFGVGGGGFYTFGLLLGRVPFFWFSVL